LLYDEVITVISSVYRTQSADVLFSPPIITYHNSQVTNSIGTKEMNKLNKLTLSS